MSRRRRASLSSVVWERISPTKFTVTCSDRSVINQIGKLPNITKEISEGNTHSYTGTREAVDKALRFVRALG